MRIVRVHPTGMNADEKLAAVVLARDGYRCLACGTTCRSTAAAVHALLGDAGPVPRTPADYMTLCPSCAHHHSQQAHLPGSQSWFERALRRLATRLDRELD